MILNKASCNLLSCKKTLFVTIMGFQDNYFDGLITRKRMKSDQDQLSPLKNANSALSLNQTVSQSNLASDILSTKNLFRSTSKFNRIHRTSGFFAVPHAIDILDVLD
jgi:hypothetical protein